MVIFLQNAHTPRFSVDFACICIQIFPKFYVFICINTVKMLLYMQIFLGVVSLLNPEFSNSYLQVDSQKIVKNMHSIQAELGPGVECIPVLKDNAYCLGALPIAKALCDHARIRTLAVAQVCEGAELREAGLNAPAILVLGGVPQRLFAAAVHYQLQLTVFHPSAVYALERLAQEQGTTAQVQIKIETGLNRTGAKPGAELAALIDALSRCPHIHVAGAFSHFATGETKESPLAYRQFALYQQGLAQLKGAGIVLSRRYLRKPVQIVCIILCVLLALASVAYIGLTILFVDAVSVEAAPPPEGAVLEAPPQAARHNMLNARINAVILFFILFPPEMKLKR